MTPRRWIVLSNPKLSVLITSRIGERWITNLEGELPRLEPFAADAGFRDEWRAVKADNKQALAACIKERTGVTVDPESLFDIQVKRLHEYKRQHLNVLYLITLYNRLARVAGATTTPRTVIFGGKAAPGYRMAKLIIKLIHAVAAVINSDPRVSQLLKVVFLPDFNVKTAHCVYPAADLSEQISTAGKEASGTGNMKFAMNGALTIGTLDGANVEIREAVGPENFFLFGLNAGEVERAKAAGYTPRRYYESNAELREAIDLIDSGAFHERRSRGVSSARRFAPHPRRLPAAGRLSGVCGLPAARQRRVPRPDGLDAHVDPELREGRAILVGPLDSRLLPRHLARQPDDAGRKTRLMASTAAAAGARGVERGSSSPLGASVQPDGVNFSVFSNRATGIELLLFDDGNATQPSRIVPLAADVHRTHHYWHAFVPGLGPGQVYGYRAHGPFAPERGWRFDGDKLLLDPYGLVVSVPDAYDRDGGGAARSERGERDEECRGRSRRVRLGR